MKSVRYRIEAFLLNLIVTGFSALPVAQASNLGGKIGQFIGPKLGISKRARKNIQKAFPNYSDIEIKKIIKGMWNNLGRVIGEYPHLETLAQHHTNIINANILDPFLSSNKGIIFISGHIGNWEINASASLLQKNIAVDITYRALNNPYSDKILMRLRSLNGKISAHAKSRIGGRTMIETIKNHGALGILIDQKYREGLNIPFFGTPAMTNPFFIQLAQKFDVPVIPIRCERLSGAEFRITVEEPIETKNRTSEDILKECHTVLERWITERPEQWLWLHRRWKE